MFKLNLPEYDLRQEMRDGRLHVLDPFRRRWLQLTPEEEVRQRFVAYLLHEKGYPASLMRTEHTLHLNGMVRRCDILVDKPAGIPSLMVECKAPSVKINQKVFDQAARYNLVLRLPFLVLTNGIQHFCCRVDFEAQKVELLSEIPSWAALG